MSDTERPRNARQERMENTQRYMSAIVKSGQVEMLRSMGLEIKQGRKQEKQPKQEKQEKRRGSDGQEKAQRESRER